MPRRYAKSTRKTDSFVCYGILKTEASNDVHEEVLFTATVPLTIVRVVGMISWKSLSNVSQGLVYVYVDPDGSSALATILNAQPIGVTPYSVTGRNAEGIIWSGCHSLSTTDRAGPVSVDTKGMRKMEIGDELKLGFMSEDTDAGETGITYNFKVIYKLA